MNKNRDGGKNPIRPKERPKERWRLRFRFATRLLVCMICFGLHEATFAQHQHAQHRIVFEGSIELPNVLLNGNAVHIHTQGLFVTDDHFLVTGRLESSPKRAMLLRFSRKDPRSYEIVDITPPPIDGAALDHPGGFDCDSTGRFWIPLSTSNAKGPSLIASYTIEADKPLKEMKTEATFQVSDHIGALCRGKDDSLLGANWDTKHVYLWSSDGKLQKRLERSKAFTNQPDWTLAVQDWKFHQSDQETIVVAGGLDKSKTPNRAAIQFIDFINGEILETHVFESRAGVTRPITNEGLAIYKQELFLLPEDLGRGAKLLRYRFRHEE